MTKARLESLLARVAKESIKKIAPESFTKDNGDPTCLVTPILESIKYQLADSGIKYSMDSSDVEKSNPNDFVVDTETNRYRYTFKVPYKTAKDKESALMLTLHVTTYWYENTRLGRNEINAYYDVMTETAFNRS